MAKKGYIDTIKRLKFDSDKVLYKRYRVIVKENGHQIYVSKLISSRKKAESWLKASQNRWERMAMRKLKD